MALPNTSLAVSRPRRSERAVDHVVMQQRGGVDELDDRRRLRYGAAGVAAGAGREQHQQRAQPLAARMDDVGGHLVDQRHLAVQTVL